MWVGIARKGAETHCYVRYGSQQTGRWHFFYDGQGEDIIWLSWTLTHCYYFRYIADNPKNHWFVISLSVLLKVPIFYGYIIIIICNLENAHFIKNYSLFFNPIEVKLRDMVLLLRSNKKERRGPITPPQDKRCLFFWQLICSSRPIAVLGSPLHNWLTICYVHILSATSNAFPLTCSV